ncbi:hypothetical protein BT96DRAFT_923260 [Gymnopus androsaceus JB14]|uniref:Uncharacterized protein n=1 Tax=Gymnopus androsaceus JB14 TaxID=1447944 RepID=A0A6A4HC68_9AGAR|nr:hypothetical protein BT96DRAFT_923260 [Gymnopus androsaceus JB14]
MRLINLSAAAVVGFGLLSTVFAIPVASLDSGNNDVLARSDELIAALNAREVPTSTVNARAPAAHKHKQASTPTTISITFTALPKAESESKSETSESSESTTAKDTVPNEADEKEKVEALVKKAAEAKKIGTVDSVYEFVWGGTVTPGTETTFIMRIEGPNPQTFQGRIPRENGQKKATLETGKGRVIIALKLASLCAGLLKVCGI